MNPAWEVNQLPQRSPAIKEYWRLRSGHALRADLIVWLSGRIEWTVGRRGEFGTRWRSDWHLENARLDAEAALEDLPVYGPLPADAFERGR